MSGWLEVQQIKAGTNEAGAAKVLLMALRRLMATFGVPTEISSNGGPEFTAHESKWGIRHSLSSAFFPSSNGRAYLAVKSAKHMLMDNIGQNGSLDTDAMVRALLVHRNTPDLECKLSPAQILLGRPFCDTLPCINKEAMVFSNAAMHTQWKEAWLSKEEALKARYVKTLESLWEQKRILPKLNTGDLVMIQDQSRPKKWDKSGVVIEIIENYQYLVKVDGSGGLTLCNRRSLRKYKPHFRSCHAQISKAYMHNFACAPSCEDVMLPDANVTGSDTRRSTMQELRCHLQTTLHHHHSAVQHHRNALQDHQSALQYHRSP